jgi:hypothetical protein
MLYASIVTLAVVLGTGTVQLSGNSHDSSVGEVCVQCCQQLLLVALLKLSGLWQLMRFLEALVPVITSILATTPNACHTLEEQGLSLPPSTAQQTSSSQRKSQRFSNWLPQVAR